MTEGNTSRAYYKTMVEKEKMKMQATGIFVLAVGLFVVAIALHIIPL